jgi:HEAT repeat protein
MKVDTLSDAQERLTALQAAAASPGRDQAIVVGLKDASPLVRQNAIALAARHLAPEVLAEFLADDEDAILRNAAQAALERQGPHAIPHLLSLTRGADPELAFFAVQILSTINDVSAKQALLPLLDHSDRNIAQAAVEALGHMRATEAVPALIRLLAGDPWLQFAAASALGRIGDARAVGPLLERLDDELLAEIVVEALGRMGDAATLAPLLDRLVSSDRLPLRDQLLLAVAAVLERNPGLRGVPARARLWRPEVRAGLGEYLGGLLAMHDATLARSAGVLVVHAELWNLMPALLARNPDSGEEGWLEGMLRRCRRRARAEWLPLLQHSDPRVRAGALLQVPFGAGAGPAVAACLQDRDPEVRAAACFALGRLREPSAASALARALRSSDAREHAAAAQALAQLPRQSLAELAPDLEPGADEEQMERALGVLEQARSTMHRERVRALVQDGRPALRQAALRVLGRYPGHAADGWIMAGLRDDDTVVRIATVEILVHRRCRKAIPALVELLSAGHPLRYHLVRALGRLRARAAASRLQALYAGAPLHERIEIVVALNQMAPAGLLAFLREVLREPDVELRRVASDGFVRAAGAHEFETMVALARDADWVVRNHATWGLGRLGLPEAQSHLMLLARDVEPLVARTAQAAMGRLRGNSRGRDA